MGRLLASESRTLEVVLLLLTQVVCGAACGGSVRPPSTGFPPTTTTTYRPELILKIEDDVSFNYQGGEYTGSELNGLRYVLNQYEQGMKILPLFKTIADSAGIEEFQPDSTAIKRVTDGDVHQLIRYCKVAALDFQDAENLRQRIAPLDLIESVYHRPLIAPLTGSCDPFEPPRCCATTPVDLTWLQGYLESASEGGMGSRPAWEVVTGTSGSIPSRSDSVDVMVIDAYLHEGHRDLPTNISTPLAYSDPNWDEDHGTHVLGILAAQPQEDGEVGMVGMVPDARFHFAAYDDIGLLGYAPADPINFISTVVSIDRALQEAYASLGPGDVLVISLGDVLYKKDCDAECNCSVDPLEVPVNAQPAYRTLIINLVEDKGVTVVLAAGNESIDLSSTYYPPQCLDSSGSHIPWVAEGDPSVGPSDPYSIIVGAGSPATRLKIIKSNYGARVDCQAWGSDVATLDFDRIVGGVLPCWVSDFGNTSAAAPMVGGVVASLQGALQESGADPLPPVEVRNQLRDADCGSEQPSDDAATAWIGPRPDLMKLLDGLDLLPKLYLRDFLGDESPPADCSGGVSELKRFQSPDIVLMNSPFLPDLGEVADVSNYDTLEPQYVDRTSEAEAAIIRLKNFGPNTGSGTVYLYNAPASPLAPPSAWKRIGIAGFLDLGPSDARAVVAADPLPSPVGDDLYLSWIAVNLPHGSGLTRASIEGLGDDYIEFLRSHPNIRFRNLEHVNTIPPDDFRAEQWTPPFSVRLYDLSAFGTSQALRFNHKMPPGSRIRVRSETTEFEINVGTGALDWISLPETPDEIVFNGMPEMLPGGVLQINHLRFREGLEWIDLEIEVGIPATATHREHELYVDQLLLDTGWLGHKLAGRMNYVVVPRVPGPL